MLCQPRIFFQTHTRGVSYLSFWYAPDYKIERITKDIQKILGYYGRFQEIMKDFKGLQRLRG